MPAHVERDAPVGDPDGRVVEPGPRAELRAVHAHDAASLGIGLHERGVDPDVERLRQFEFHPGIAGGAGEDHPRVVVELPENLRFAVRRGAHVHAVAADPGLGGRLRAGGRKRRRERGGKRDGEP